MTDNSDQGNPHWCIHWCYYLDRDDTKPWYQKTNCGKVTLKGLIYFGYFLLTMIGIIVLLDLTTVVSYGFQTVYGIPNCTVTEWSLWTDCSLSGMMSILAMLLHMLGTFPIVLMIAYTCCTVEELLCKCRCSQFFNFKSITGWILTMVWIIIWCSFSIFVSPYLDQIFYYNSPCNFAQYYTAGYDNNFCAMRNFLGIVFVDVILGIGFLIAACTFCKIEDWKRNAINDQRNNRPGRTRSSGSTTDQTMVELETDSRTNSV